MKYDKIDIELKCFNLVCLWGQSVFELFAKELHEKDMLMNSIIVLKTGCFFSEKYKVKYKLNL